MKVPLTSDDIFAALALALEDECGLGEVELCAETTALELPGWDSLAHVRIIMNLEQRLSVNIDIDESYRAETVGDLVKQISDAPGPAAA